MPNIKSLANNFDSIRATLILLGFLGITNSAQSASLYLQTNASTFAGSDSHNYSTASGSLIGASNRSDSTLISGTSLYSESASANGYATHGSIATTLTTSREYTLYSLCCGSSATVSYNLRDEITVSNSAYDGQDGIIHGKLAILTSSWTAPGPTNGFGISESGHFDISANVNDGSASWFYSRTIADTLNGQIVQVSQNSIINSNPCCDIINLDGSEKLAYFDVDIPFTEGISRGLWMDFGVTFNSAGGTSAGSVAMYWAGIQSVTINGSPISYVLSSTSGTDYTRSLATVPIPPTILLLGSALAGLGIFRKSNTATNRTVSK
jgi:hypothetical protein